MVIEERAEGNLVDENVHQSVRVLPHLAIMAMMTIKTKMTMMTKSTKMTMMTKLTKMTIKTKMTMMTKRG